MAAFSDLSVKPEPREHAVFSVPAVSSDSGLPLIKPGCQAKLTNLRESQSSSWPQPGHTPCQEAVDGLWEAVIKQVKNLKWLRSGCAGSGRSSRVAVAPPSLQHCCCRLGAAFLARVTSWEGPSLFYFAWYHHLLLGTCCVPTQGCRSAAEEASDLPWPCWEGQEAHDGAGGRVLPREEPPGKWLTSILLKSCPSIEHWLHHPWEQEAYLQQVMCAACFHFTKKSHFRELHGAAIQRQWKFAWMPKTQFCRVSHLCVRKRRSSLLVPNSSISRPKSLRGWYKKKKKLTDTKPSLRLNLKHSIWES